MLDCVQIETGLEPDAAVIWLHGLGADGHDFEPVVPQLRWSEQPALRYVFPHAPVRPVTINNGMAMRAWYDIVGIDLRARQDAPSIAAASDDVVALIERERERGISSDRIILAGFSQGGAIALYTGLRYPHALAGIIALSCYLPLVEQTAAERAQGNIDTPIFMAHGIQDPVVPVDFGRISAAWLRDHGHAVQWTEYPMPHAVNAEEIADVRDFLALRLSR